MFGSLKAFFMVMLIILGFSAFAQEVPISSADFFSYLFSALGGLKGAGTLAIVGVVVQVLLKLLNSDLFSQWFSSVSGAVKLIVISGLTVAGSVIGLMSQGQSFWAAVTSGGVVTALMVFAHQVYLHFFAPAPSPLQSLKK